MSLTKSYMAWFAALAILTVNWADYHPLIMITGISAAIYLFALGGKWAAIHETQHTTNTVKHDNNRTYQPGMGLETKARPQRRTQSQTAESI
jgi:hypothetical protein